MFENPKKSPKATDIIAYGETIGQSRIIQPLAESEQPLCLNCSTLSASERVNNRIPGDARRAIMFVIFDD